MFVTIVKGLGLDGCGCIVEQGGTLPEQLSYLSHKSHATVRTLSQHACALLTLLYCVQPKLEPKLKLEPNHTPVAAQRSENDGLPSAEQRSDTTLLETKNRKQVGLKLVGLTQSFQQLCGLVLQYLPPSLRPLYLSTPLFPGEDQSYKSQRTLGYGPVVKPGQPADIHQVCHQT